jgi:hypothetical protein
MLITGSRTGTVKFYRKIKFGLIKIYIYSIVKFIILSYSLLFLFKF